jgi:type I restriction enzyme R subunit
MSNQNPEKQARDNIDKQLNACEWIIQDKQLHNLFTGLGVVFGKYSTEVGQVCYLTFVNPNSILKFY